MALNAKANRHPRTHQVLLTGASLSLHQSALHLYPSAEADSLRQRVSLEQARVGELEGLLAIARADQVRSADGTVQAFASWVPATRIRPIMPLTSLS